MGKLNGNKIWVISDYYCVIFFLNLISRDSVDWTLNLTEDVNLVNL